MQIVPEPKTMIAIKDLSLAARTTIDGFMSGMNKSRAKGEGAEFSHYRNYLPGDDLRSLDWKVFARTGRHYIKESEPDRTIAVHLMMDISASMNHECGGYTKLQYGCYLTACLALLAYRQGDKTALSLFNDSEVNHIKPNQHGQQLQRIYDTLTQIEARGLFENVKNHRHALQAGGKELVVFMTDFYEHDEEIIRLLKLFTGLGSEVIVFHLMAENELKMRFDGYDALEDLETGKRIQFKKESGKQASLLTTHIDHVKHRLLKNNISYYLVNTNDTAENVLSYFLKRRNKPFY